MNAERFAATLEYARPYFTGFRHPLLLGIAIGWASMAGLVSVYAVWSCR